MRPLMFSRNRGFYVLVLFTEKNTVRLKEIVCKVNDKSLVH